MAKPKKKSKKLTIKSQSTKGVKPGKVETKEVTEAKNVVPDWSTTTVKPWQHSSR